MRPDSEQTAQQLSDQVRSVLRRNVLSRAELEQLKAEVRSEQDPDAEAVQQQNRLSQATERRRTRFSLAPTQEPEALNEQILTTFQESNLRYSGIDMSLRPKLPKVRYNQVTKKTVHGVDKILARQLAQSQTIEETCHLTYCAAATVCIVTGLNIKDITDTQSSPSPKTPPWKTRLERKITDIRKEIGIINTYLTRIPSKHTRKAVKKIVQLHHLEDQSIARLTVLMDNLKQKIAVLGCRLRRYNEAHKRKQQNKEFSLNAKMFFRDLGKREERKAGVIPDEDKMREFWSKIWSEEKQHEEAYWVADEEKRVEGVPQMEPVNISVDNIKEIVQSLGNWKAPGIDRIQAYWWKHLTSTHETLATQFTEALQNPTLIPNYFTHGITYMLPKSNNTEDPKNFRPITCLPVIYKIFTSAVEKAISRHLKRHSVLAREQNGSRKGSRGSTEWLIIDSIVGRQACRNKRNISVAWIDYRKAFDSVPHSWLLRTMEIYKICPSIIATIKHLMGTWRTILSVQCTTRRYTTKPLAIKRGIFQGDSLSPLLFCMAVNPLSFMLESSTNGFLIQKTPAVKICHLLYMDDLKTYAANPEQLQSQLELVRIFSKSIHMEFGIDKCAFIHCKKGQIQESENITLLDQMTISPLTVGTTYKYLGIQQALKPDDTDVKRTVQDSFLSRLNAVLKTELYAKNKITAINMWVAPIVINTFGVLKWSKTDLENLDRKIRTSMTKYRMHHPHASSLRLYLPRDKGGRGLVNLTSSYEDRIGKLQEFFERTDYPLHRAVRTADKNLSPLNLAAIRQPVNKKTVSETIDEWKSKPLHGRYPTNLYGPETDSQLSVRYLRDGALRAETEGFMTAIQDQEVPTRNFLKYIAKQTVPDDRCRLCQAATETIQHISSACTYLAPRQYLERHNKVAGILHQEICKKENLLNEIKPYYCYLPEAVRENETVKIYWDTDIITDRMVEHNRPDILILNKQKKEAHIIDISIPLDENIRRARVEKLTKYTKLGQEIKAIYQLKDVRITAIILTCNGLVDKQLSGNLERIGVENPKRVIAEMQKSVVLSTCNIVRSVLTHD